ncbi:MAG: ArsJ-associated glyceraldehyde-3-phosphate dehydrogenase [Caldilineaceae bacterium]|nr:ArsJ-associated glyceraldehyde-3-phosphate dehydrogenase [Caldilineaceae bacterium]
MAVRVGINGFGRIGRLALRAGWTRSEIEFVHINDPAIGLEGAAHLLEFDSVHGRWTHAVDVVEQQLGIGERRLSFSEAKAPEAVPWRDLGIDLVLECSGKFRTLETLTPYLTQGVRKVVVSAPVKGDVLNIVMGCNDELYNPDEHHIVTAASCTTNCLAPVVKVIHQGLGIEHGMITTIHDVTNTQVVVDAPHKDLRRARSAILNLIPTSTGSATAITMIYPELKGKLNGVAVRVPLLNASLTDAVFEVKRPTSAAEVNALFKTAAAGDLAGILGYEERPLVSSDYRNDPRSAIVDAGSTMVVDGTLVKVFAWYDNEWGYANRMVDLAVKVAQLL